MIFILSPVDSLNCARTFQLQEKEQELKEKGQVFGKKCLELLGNVNPDGQSLKMSQLSLIEDSQSYLTTLPKQGMMLNGSVYRQTKLELDIKENEYGLLPTPVASDYHARRKTKNWKGNDLVSRVAEMEYKSIQVAYLNPDWVEWLMGYPIGYTNLEEYQG